ncbi:hypothetical protein DNTS_034503, partial [Danionella cerebrum]
MQLDPVGGGDALKWNANRALQAQKKKLKRGKRLLTDDEVAKGDGSGAKRKPKSSGTIVKSRYMQIDAKVSLKSRVQEQSIMRPPRPSSPKVNIRKLKDGLPSRRTMGPLLTMGSSCLESSNLGGVFHSTVLDGHSIHPDCPDISVIKDEVLPANEEEREERDPAMQTFTFILAFLTAKIEHNTKKLKEEAERKILIVMEKEQQLRSEVNQKKRKYLLQKKQTELNAVLDLQMEALGPVASAAKAFADEYSSFATAIDATRHKLPVKHVHIGEDAEQFLNDAGTYLNASKQILEQYTESVSSDCEALTTSLEDMNKMANEISLDLKRYQ